ncbi:MAG: dephospho-CoA kinase [Bacteroidota bacterium]|jgi:dephospho-CoA kinase
MLKVGLTGGIGAGKSIVASIFRHFDIPVYDADAAAKRLMHEDEGIKEKIIDLFGDTAYSNGKLNRSLIAAQVFADKSKLDLLNHIVHPATIKDAAAWFIKQDCPYAIKEAALLFESGSAEGLDLIIGVTAPLPLRIRRAMQRDQSTKEQIEDRMKYQMEDAIKMKLCDFVVNNDEIQLVIPQVLNIHEALLQKQKENRLP